MQTSVQFAAVSAFQNLVFCVCNGAFGISQNSSFTPYTYGSHYIQWQNSNNSEMRWHNTNVTYVDMYFMCSFCDGNARAV
jgi:hypothetical protein